MRATRLLAFLLSFGMTLAAQDSRPAGDPESEASADVARIYSKEFIGWGEHVARLDSEYPMTAEWERRYLVALLTRLHEDQLAGRSAQRFTGAWGRSSEDVARETRQDIVEYLVSKPATEGKLVPLRSVAENDSNATIARIAMNGIVACKLPAATATLVRIVNEDRGGATTIARALEELAKRGVIPERNAIERHLRSHRRMVRLAAAPLAARAGIPVPPAPEGAAWFETEGGAALMRRLAALVGPSLPQGTPFVEVDTIGNGGGAFPTRDHGWLLEEKDGFIRIETPNGYLKTIRLGAPPGQKSPNHRYRVIEPAAELERVVALRTAIDTPDRESRPAGAPPTVTVGSAGDPPGRSDYRGELSDCGVLSGQFEPMAYSLYEVMLGFRLYQFGLRDLAARVLPHVVEATPNDEDFLYFVQWFLGDALGHRMLARFCEHDLAAAEMIANRIVTHFPRSQFVRVARRLLDEIPRRRDDWKGFRLPTPEEWTFIAEGLNREGQIRYLCERARLLTAVSGGMIGTFPFYEPQYPRPRAVDHRVSGFVFEPVWGDWKDLRDEDPIALGWVLGERLPSGEVINPLRVLRDGPLSPRQLGQPPSGVDAEDIPLLRSLEKPEWLACDVNGWRFFHSGRWVSTTTDLIEFLITEVERK